MRCLTALLIALAAVAMMARPGAPAPDTAVQIRLGAGAAYRHGGARGGGSPDIASLRLRGGAGASEGGAMPGDVLLDATVRSWRELSSPPPSPGAPARSIYEVELEVAAAPGSDASVPPYQPGDCIAIRAPNPPDLVLALAELLPSRGGTASDSRRPSPGFPAVLFPPTYTANVRQSLERSVRLPEELLDLIWERDLSSLTKLSLRSLADHCADARDAEYLRRLATSPREFMARIQSPAINIVELLESVQSCRPPLWALLELLPPLARRSYSIASSPLQFPPCTGTFSLTFAFALVNRTLVRDATHQPDDDAADRPAVAGRAREESLQRVDSLRIVQNDDGDGEASMCGLADVWHEFLGRRAARFAGSSHLATLVSRAAHKLISAATSKFAAATSKFAEAVCTPVATAETRR